MPGSEVGDGDRQDGIVLVYDGDCPLCRHYATLTRIRTSAGALVLHDARSGGEIVAWLSRHGVDLDEGMAVIIGGTVHHGAEALHVLALLGTRSDGFNRAMGALFRHRRLTRLLYPVMRAGRRLLLTLRGRGPLQAGRAESRSPPAR